MCLFSRDAARNYPELGAFNPSLLSNQPQNQEPGHGGEIRRVPHSAVTFEREPRSRVAERASLPGETSVSTRRLAEGMPGASMTRAPHASGRLLESRRFTDVWP